MYPFRIDLMRNFPIISQKSSLKIAVILFWGMFLSLNTWTSSLEKMLAFQSVGFKWDLSPNFISFFYFHDLALAHPDFLFVKLGHFVGFAIMDLLIFSLFKGHKISIGLSITFAFLTEFLQLFFGRDDRLFDLGIDSLGILSVYFLINLLKLADQR
jgi:hypothetical protein